MIGHYTGTAGQRYFENRAGFIDDESQRKRAAFFTGLTTPDDVVLDFGCGTGGLVSCLPAARRLGVDVSEFALEHARERLDGVFNALDEVTPGSVDVAISFHAIEHVAEPHAALSGIFRTLRPGGLVKVFVPYDNVLFHRDHRKWSAEDPVRHLYTWTPRSLGNLLESAGFEMLEAGLSPNASGGRLAEWLAPMGLAKTAPWIKAIRAGRIHVYALARRPAASHE